MQGRGCVEGTWRQNPSARRRSSRSISRSTARSGCRSIIIVQCPSRSIASRSAAECMYTGPPSMPCCVIIASPRTCSPSTSIATFFSGTPANRSAKCCVHSTRMPQLAGRRSLIFTPAPRSTSTHVPSEPTRGQLAPPNANRATSLATSIVLPPCTEKRDRRGSAVPSGDSAHPSHRWRTSIVTPNVVKRDNQARSSGVARQDAGKTCPVDPTNVGSPSEAHQWRSSAGPKPSIAPAR